MASIIQMGISTSIFYEYPSDEVFRSPEKLQLTKPQQSALKHIKNKSAKEVKQYEHLCKQRFKKRRIDAPTVEKMSKYLYEEAPIVIHINLTRNLQYILNDTQYRNQFEIDERVTVQKELRRRWEDRLFDCEYQHASNQERVRYGALNFTKNINGVYACQNYGESYFVLKNDPELRARCTLTNKDSCNQDAIITNLELNYKVLNTFQMEELQALAKVMKGEPVDSYFQGYKQIQIHGSLLFNRDFAQLYIGRFDIQRYSLEGSKLLLFCKSNRITPTFL